MAPPQITGSSSKAIVVFIFWVFMLTVPVLWSSLAAYRLPIGCGPYPFSITFGNEVM